MNNLKVKNANFNDIPIIDIGPLYNANYENKEIHKIGKIIKDSCKEFGFFYIKNHQISQNHIDSLIPLMRKFFKLPLEEKNKINIKNSKIFRGYTPLGQELTNGKYDWHECVDFGLDFGIKGQCDAIYKKQLLGPNQWPETPYSLKIILKKHWDLMIYLGRIITQGLALSLEIPKDYFSPYMNKSHCYMRLSHYPPLKCHQENKGIEGIGPHIDYGFITILFQDEIGGLEIKNSKNKWISAPIIPGTFLINIGHMIQRWTNNYYKATIHRVIQPNKKEGRYSLPFFFEPNFDTIVTPIKKFCGKDKQACYKPIHFGNYLKRTFKNSYSSIVK